MIKLANLTKPLNLTKPAFNFSKPSNNSWIAGKFDKKPQNSTKAFGKPEKKQEQKPEKKPENRTFNPGNNKTAPPKNHTKEEGKRGGPRILDQKQAKLGGFGNRTNFKADRAPPKIKLNMNLTRPAKGFMPMQGKGPMQGPGKNMTKGPQFAKFDPTERKGPMMFKGGAKRHEAENICKKRYQQIMVTALGNLTATNSSRILQSDQEVFTMTLEIGTSDFSGASSLLFSAIAVMFTVFAFF